MKKEIIEYLGFDDENKPKVGRPRLADKKTKQKSLIIASASFIFVILLLIFGYGTLFGFRNLNLKGSVVNQNKTDVILVNEIKPLINDVTIKVGTARKLYLTVLPANANDKSVSYKSSNPDVLSVDENGKVVGLSVGNASVVVTTNDGSNLKTTFNVNVITNAEGKCEFTSLSKTTNGIFYQTECSNAKIKEIQYKVGNDNYEKLLTKKTSDEVKFSKEQMEKEITLKVVYYPNNSKITKYQTKTIKSEKTTTKAKTGSCNLEIKDVKASSARYDVSCKNASVSKIAYKIGNGSYVGIEPSSLADTVIFEENDVTRVIYFIVEYSVDGSKKINTITKNSIIEKGR